MAAKTAIFVVPQINGVPQWPADTEVEISGNILREFRVIGPSAYDSPTVIIEATRDETVINSMKAGDTYLWLEDV